MSSTDANTSPNCLQPLAGALTDASAWQAILPLRTRHTWVKLSAAGWFHAGKDAFFISDPLADTGIMGGNTPKDTPIGQVWLSDGENCESVLQLER